MDLDERRLWLFPEPRGDFDGIDLDLLDPHDEGDRQILVRAEHPELHRAIGASDEEFDDGGHRLSPVAHLAIHEVVAAQLWNDDPPEVGQTADRLVAQGFDRHEVLHMLGAVNTAEAWHVSRTQEPTDPERVRAALGALPQSLDLHDDDDAFHDDDDDLLASALQILSERGPCTAEELAEELSVDLEDVEDLIAEPGVTVLADLRLASLTDLLDEVVFTHRLNLEESQGEALEMGVDLLPVERMLCAGDHLHLADGSIGELVHGDAHLLGGDPGWLGGAAAGDLLAFRIVEVAATDAGVAPVVAVEKLADPPVTPDTFAVQLASSFNRFGQGDRLPVAVVDLLCQVAVDAPALMAQVLAPLSELFEIAGFEVRDGHAAPLGTDWERFMMVRSVAEVASRYGLDLDETHVLVMLCELVKVFDAGGRNAIDRRTLSTTAQVFSDPDIAEAFAEANGPSSDPALHFLERMRALTGNRHAADLAWAQSLLARRANDPESAESYIRLALSADPDHEAALEDAAWYASDRGDARAAVRFLQRLELDPDEDRTRMLRGYISSGDAKVVGRNDPCSCGSGRKYKHCCLGASPALPALPGRVRWIWEKLRWWLDRSGREVDAFDVTLAMHGPPAKDDIDSFSVDLDIAASLVLFADGAVSDFLAERSALLPADEANLVTQWALTERSVHEIVSVDSGRSVTLRDLRTGDVVEIVERSGSRYVMEGDLVFAHAVFDGEGHQFVGGLVPIPLLLRDPLLALIDSQPTAMQLAELLGSARRPPQLFNVEGEPVVACEARYRVSDSQAAAGALDRVFDRNDDRWVEWIEVEEQRWMRAVIEFEGDTLVVSTNSETRFERVKEAVERVVEGVELLAEKRVRPDQVRNQPGQPSPVPEGATAALDHFVREQEHKWVDEPVPALAGLTPRQAAADPTRREDLIALLHDFDRYEPPPGAASFDPTRLRELLGLSKG